MNATDQLKDLFAEAMVLPPDEQTAYLNEVCQGDGALRVKVQKLLDAHRQAEGFLHVATRQIPEAPEDAANVSEPVGTRIGPYKLLQLIGEGGFGSVYMAEQEQPVRRRVALKLIKLGMDTRHVIARFEAERQALAMMDHPNIAKVLDAGATDRGRPYFVMELVRGEPITQFCDRNRLTIEQRLRLFCSVCEAVQHAHTKGIIHRDLKPSNALVTIGDNGPVPKVIDFGIAKATSAKLTDKTLFTEFRQLIGTPEYMSPEQAESSAMDVDTRTDVYSLGVLLYELLTGATPFDGGRLRSVAFGELQRIIREDDPPRPSTKLSSLQTLPSVAAQRGVEPKSLASKLRGELDWVVMKCIEKDRARRYETADALATDIRHFLNGDPVSAVPPTLVYRTRKFVRRHRVATLTSVLVGIALIIGAVGTTVGMLRARESEAGAMAVNEFMSQVLTSVDPDSGGRDVRLVDVLDDASRSAAQRFKSHPLLEAQVRHLLARVYKRLTMPAQAKAERRQALEVLTRELGPDDRRTLAAHVAYASQFQSNEDTRQLETMLTDLLPRVNRAFDENEQVSIELQRLVGMMELLRGDYDQAERTLQHARALASQRRENDSLQINILEALIRMAKSRVWDVDREDRPAKIDALESLAREAAAINLSLHGPDSLDSLIAQVRLAEAVNLRGGHKEAADTCRVILATSTERLGECHDVREHAMEVLSHAAARLGEEQEAADLVLRRLACLRAGHFSELSPTWLGALSDSMRFLDRAGRGPEGEAIAREFSAQIRALGGGHDAMAYESDMYAAGFVSMQGRLDEADAMFEALLKQNVEPPDEFTRARLLMFYGLHLVRRGRFAEAEEHLKQTAKMIGDIRAGTWDTHPDDIIVAFMALYQAWNKPVEVETYRRLQAEVTGRPLKATAP